VSFDLRRFAFKMRTFFKGTQGEENDRLYQILEVHNIESQIAIPDTLHVINDRQMRAPW
jgi:hypothetical protein